MLNIYDEDILSTISGSKRPDCSGTHKSLEGLCKPFKQSICRGTAIFEFSGEGLKIADQKFAKPQLQIEDAGESSNVFMLSDRNQQSKLNFSFTASSPFPLTAGNTLAMQVRKIDSVVLQNLATKDQLNVTRFAQIHDNGIIEIPLNKSLQKVLGGSPSFYSLEATGECFLTKPIEKEWRLPIFTAPNLQSRQLGSILIQGPTENVTKVSITSDGKTAPLQADFEINDWGYDFKFGLSILEQKGEWLQVSLCPALPPGWVMVSGQNRVFDVAGVAESVLSINGEIHTTPDNPNQPSIVVRNNIVIQGIDGDLVRFRFETSSDMPCENESKAIPQSPVKLYKAALREFYDSNYRLKVRPAYPKGC
jgi:hypothetical protein